MSPLPSQVRALTVAGALASVLALSGCGTNPGDRALSGAAIGAGAGAIIGAATGSPATGAAIGAIGGAAVGAVTNPCDLNLGDPYWRDHGGRDEYDRRCRHRDHHEDDNND
jgi:osmotically inducible lipoprotein OsmB